jgi:hypothetical protein
MTSNKQIKGGKWFWESAETKEVKAAQENNIISPPTTNTVVQQEQPKKSFFSFFQNIKIPSFSKSSKEQIPPNEQPKNILGGKRKTKGNKKMKSKKSNTKKARK